MSSKIYHERQSLFRCAVHTVNALLQQPKHTPQTFDNMGKKLGISSTFGNYDINVIEGILLSEGLELEWWGKRGGKRKEESGKREKNERGEEGGGERNEEDYKMREEGEGREGGVGDRGGGRETEKKGGGLEENKEGFERENEGGREGGGEEGRAGAGGGGYLKWREKGVVGMIFNDRGEKGAFSSIRRFFSPNHWFALKQIDGVYWNLDSRLRNPVRMRDQDVKSMVESTLYNEGFVFLIKSMEF